MASVREMGRAGAALYIGGMGAKGKNFYNALASRYGYEKEAAEIQDLYLSGQKKEAAAKVPADLLEAMSLCGPEGYIKERLAAFAEAGVTHLNVTPVGGDPVAMIEKLAELAVATHSGRRRSAVSASRRDRAGDDGTGLAAFPAAIARSSSSGSSPHVVRSTPWVSGHEESAWG